jgi:hypothetical protein
MVELMPKMMAAMTDQVCKNDAKFCATAPKP